MSEIFKPKTSCFLYGCTTCVTFYTSATRIRTWVSLRICDKGNTLITALCFILSDCPGTQSEQAGKTSSCQGCPNQKMCASGATKAPDPGKTVTTS